MFLGKVVLLFFIISGAVQFIFLKNRSGIAVQRGFLARNFWRLWVPGAAALVFSTLLYFAARLVKGSGEVPSASEFFSNLFFIAHFVGEDWTNVSLWNIAVQLQHILWIGLIIIPLMRYRNGPLAASLALLVTAIVLDVAIPEGRRDALHYFPHFFLGYVLYEVMAHDRRWLLVPAVGAIAWISGVFGMIAGVISLVPFALLLVNDSRVFRHPVVVWLGKISFSLYLVHVPVSKRVINLGARWATNDFEAAIVYAVALAAIFATAIAFHKWIEEPCTRRARLAFS